jgi:lipopolysaccharide biosynthesis regulator YciM
VKVENWSEALKVQRLVIDLAPWSTADEEQKNLAAYLYETGLDALNRGEVTAAKDDFRAAIRSNNRFTAAYLKQAECEERLGWGVDAIKTLEKGFKATRSLVLLKFLEALLLKKEGAPRAVGELRWARDIASDVSAIRLFLATAYLAAGDPAAARGEVDRMGGELSSTTIYHLVVAAVQKAEDNVSQALVSMQKAQTAEMATLFIFRCGVCHHSFREYSGRCGNCGSWNALDASIF